MPTGSSSASPGIRSGITCLLPGVGAEAVLNGNLAVVKDNPFGNTAEILKYLNQRIQKALLILPAVCQNHGDTAVAQSRAEGCGVVHHQQGLEEEPLWQSHK